MSGKPAYEILEKRIQELEKAEAAHKRTIETLRASEAKFRRFVETSSDWIWEIDNEGVYTYSNPQVEEILGYKPEDVIGKTPFDLMPPDEAKRIAVDFGNLVSAGKPIIAMENRAWS